MSSQAEPLQGQQVKKVENNNYPYVVSIGHKYNRYREEVMHFCTGVLITYEFILTAAHCFKRDLPHGIRVILGSTDLQKGRKYDVSMWLTYDEWAHIQNSTEITGENDIAIIKVIMKTKKKLSSIFSLNCKNVALYSYQR